MHGLDLLKSLIGSTGLPEEAVQRELERLVLKYGITSDEVTLPTLRLILAEYLQDVLLEAKRA